MYVPPRPSVDGFEPHLAANFLGHFLLTSLLLDKLKASAPSRIINVADMTYKRGHVNFEDLNGLTDYNKKAAYDRSKLASVAFTKELAKRTSGSSVTVNDIFPGYTETDIGRQMKSKAIRIMTKPIKWFVLQKPEKAANTLMYVATSPELDTVSGKFLRYDRASKKCM
ncbi:unnamed protein product [Soboliphyme baturini]|uniref:Retinol dehydrogenase 14 n=1 Tax=Soboliphyme baturini TaxID=241478 RepID=A0A183J8L1_9BILA|nr:unnamed protein product [Soboliphyme baturini]